MNFRSAFMLCTAWVVVSSIAPVAFADETAIRSAIVGYAEAFNKKDSKAISSMWAENGVHVNRESGERIEGRSKIEADLAQVFAASPNLRLTVNVDRVRMVSKEVAQVEGQTAVGTSDAEPSVSQFSAIAVLVDGKWLIDSIEEAALPVPSSAEDALAPLDWLVGKWVDSADGVIVETSFRWTENKTFLLRSFTVTPTEGNPSRGTQVIGWDPQNQRIRSWTFNSDGSFGDAVWSRNGDDWLIKSTQVLTDGRTASGNYLMTRAGDDSLQIELIGHEVDGEPVAASKPVIMTRADGPKSSTQPPPSRN